MPIVIGVKFDKNPKTYDFDPGEETFEVGDLVIVDTQKGNELGSVVKANAEVAELAPGKELKKVIRKANARNLAPSRSPRKKRPSSGCR